MAKPVCSCPVPSKWTTIDGRYGYLCPECGTWRVSREQPDIPPPAPTITREVCHHHADSTDWSLAAFFLGLFGFLGWIAYLVADFLKGG